MAKNLELSYLIDFYGDVLTKKQREVMEQYYNDDLSLAEIAENFGITRQGVRDSIKRGEAILLDLEEKVGFVQRFRALQSGLSTLEGLAKELQYAGKSGQLSPAEVMDKTGRMLTTIETLAE